MTEMKTAERNPAAMRMKPAFQIPKWNAAKSPAKVTAAADVLSRKYLFFVEWTLRLWRMVYVHSMTTKMHAQRTTGFPKKKIPTPTARKKKNSAAGEV